jgi:hypothetical protein
VQATSAISPALISGHSFQSCLAGAAAFYNARMLGIDARIDAALKQHSVDGGDRRVFAGVHYPSDNISSWITVMLVAPNVTPDLDGAKWVWQAITQHSLVYKTIDAFVAANPKCAYAPSMRLLKHLGAHPGMTVDEALAFALPSS